MLDLGRGSIKILDRPMMELIACECYEKVKDLYVKLYKRRPEFDGNGSFAELTEQNFSNR